MSVPSIDWSTLGFNYIKTDHRYLSRWSGNKWDKGVQGIATEALMQAAVGAVLQVVESLHTCF